MAVNPLLVQSQFSAPINGQSLTHAPKSMMYENPPQYTKLGEAMDFVMGQLLEPQHLKQMLGLMEAGMPIEAIGRTILFSGFTLGKWSPDLGMLMYKPLILALITIAHKAGISDVPVVMPDSLTKHINNKLGQHIMISSANMRTSKEEESVEAPSTNIPSNGFMKRIK